MPASSALELIGHVRIKQRRRHEANTRHWFLHKAACVVWEGHCSRSIKCPRCSRLLQAETKGDVTRGPRDNENERHSNASARSLHPQTTWLEKHSSWQYIGTMDNTPLVVTIAGLVTSVVVVVTRRGDSSRTSEHIFCVKTTNLLDANNTLTIKATKVVDKTHGTTYWDERDCFFRRSNEETIELSVRHMTASSRLFCLAVVAASKGIHRHELSKQIPKRRAVLSSRHLCVTLNWQNNRLTEGEFEWLSSKSTLM